MTSCSLIITTYNWPEALELVLKSVIDQTLLPDEVIIADDGSGDETRQLIEFYKNKVSFKLIHAWQKDDGYRINAVRNLAIKHATNPYIIQIDGDVILDKNFVADHLRFAHKKRLVVGRRVGISKENTLKFCEENEYTNLNAFRSLVICWLHNLLLYSNKSVRGLCGCNVGFWKEDAFAVNGYDEDMTSKGPNDKEFGMRLLNSGVSTFNMKFYGIQYHLYHSEGKLRSNYKHVKNLYIQTIENRKIMCNNGIKRA